MNSYKDAKMCYYCWCGTVSAGTNLKMYTNKIDSAIKIVYFSYKTNYQKQSVAVAQAT